MMNEFKLVLISNEAYIGLNTAINNPKSKIDGEIKYLFAPGFKPSTFSFLGGCSSN
jgi:hypothetical protein